MFVYIYIYICMYIYMYMYIYIYTHTHTHTHTYIHMYIGMTEEAVISFSHETVFALPTPPKAGLLRRMLSAGTVLLVYCISTP